MGPVAALKWATLELDMYYECVAELWAPWLWSNTLPPKAYLK